MMESADRFVQESEGGCKMNMPGFTGETSLYKARGHYRAMASAATAFVVSGVLPQLPIGFCQANCDKIADPFLRGVCEIQCMEQGGDGGGGGGHFCRPACTPCRPDARSSTGSSRLCRFSDCTIEHVECG